MMSSHAILPIISNEPFLYNRIFLQCLSCDYMVWGDGPPAFSNNPLPPTIRFPFTKFLRSYISSCIIERIGRRSFNSVYQYTYQDFHDILSFSLRYFRKEMKALGLYRTNFFSIWYILRWVSFSINWFDRRLQWKQPLSLSKLLVWGRTDKFVYLFSCKYFCSISNLFLLHET